MTTPNTEPHHEPSPALRRARRDLDRLAHATPVLVGRTSWPEPRKPAGPDAAKRAREYATNPAHLDGVTDDGDHGCFVEPFSRVVCDEAKRPGDPPSALVLGAVATLRRLDAMPPHLALALLYGFWWHADGDGVALDVLLVAADWYARLPPTAALPVPGRTGLDLDAIARTFAKLDSDKRLSDRSLDADALLMPAQAAVLAGCCARTLKRAADDHVIRDVRTAGGHSRYRRSEIERAVGLGLL